MIVALATGCATVSDSTKTGTEHVCDGVKEWTGKVGEWTCSGAAHMTPLGTIIDAWHSKRVERSKRNAARGAQRESDELRERQSQYCVVNKCDPACREIIIDAFGLEPSCPPGRDPDQQTSNSNSRDPSSDALRLPPRRVDDPPDTGGLVDREGFRTTTYKVEGITHVGVGNRVWHDDETRQWSIDDIVARFNDDLHVAFAIARDFAGDAWQHMNDRQRNALTECAYALGKRGLNAFVEMRDNIRTKRWNDAADELVRSAWYNSDPDRVQTLSDMIRHRKPA